MFIKIYFNDKPLFLCDAIEKTIEPYVHNDDAIFIDELDPHTVKTMIHEMELQQIHAGVFLHSNLKELTTAFFKKFTLIRAAGGLVVNEKSELLFIFRKGKWDLPKGKLDKGEKMEDCAVREIKEETGLKKAEIVKPLVVTYHTYHEGSKHILKESNWFLMHSTSNEILKPQTEEDITQIKWVNKNDLSTYLDNSFPLIKDVIKAAQAK
jgi:8-oxo-dGTP pyrophosphatase MutT (NUDIX family)